MCSILCMGLHTTPIPNDTLTNLCVKDCRIDANCGKFIKHCSKQSDYCSFISLKSAPYQIKKVVIDPGHGGRDHGCTGHGSKEKVIALKMALRLGKLIQSVYPEIEIIYTRTSDVFVPLHRRATIANQAQADLFISVHCNAMSSNASKVRGSETYVMGIHTAEENLEVAKRENASILYEDNYLETYGGYDPHSPEGHIFMSMFQNAYLEQSIQFAQAIEEQISYHAGRKSRGVKQAGFVVLRQTAMPSVLVETGYLTHQSDHTFLASSSGQQKMVESIFNAFSIYKYKIEDSY